MLHHEYLIANIGSNTSDNEPHFAKKRGNIFGKTFLAKRFWQNIFGKTFLAKQFSKSNVGKFGKISRQLDSAVGCAIPLVSQRLTRWLHWMVALLGFFPTILLGEARVYQRRTLRERGVRCVF